MMLNVFQDLIDELSSFIQQFCESNHLTKCNLNVSLPFWENVHNKPRENLMPRVNCELKSSEKHQYDIRLSFNSFQLKNWWSKLEQLARSLQIHSSFSQLSISQVSVIEKIHSVDITLNRSIVIDRLLSAGQIKQMTIPKIVLIKLTNPKQNECNYLSDKRIDFVCSVVENLLRHFHTSESVVKFDTFQQFRANFNVIQSDLQNVMQDTFGIALLNQASQRKVCEYCCLLAHYFKHLDLPISPRPTELSVVVIIVVAEAEFNRTQSAVNLLQQSAHFQGAFSFKVIKVAGISPRVTSFEDYKHLLNEESLMEDISQDNADTIAESMLAFSLLTPKLTSAITKLVHFRNEAIFVQYNIARLKSILDKYRREYGHDHLAQSESKVSFSLLTNDHEWNLVLINLLRMHLLEQSFAKQLTDNSAECQFNFNKMIDQMKKLAHSFSCYYRNVKILAEPVDHLLPLIATRVAFCDIVLKRMCFYFDLLTISTAERM